MYLANHRRVTAQSFGAAATNGFSTSRGSRSRSKVPSTVPPPEKAAKLQVRASVGPFMEGTGPHDPRKGSQAMDASKPDPLEPPQKTQEPLGKSSKMEPPGNDAVQPSSLLRVSDRPHASMPKVIPHQRPKVEAKKK